MIKSYLKRIMQKTGLVQYQGNYASWEMAEKKSKGYDANEIFEKVKEATLKVANGEAAYERDSWLFYEREFNYPLISHLEKACLETGNKYLHVIDWGGALGSTYYQNKEMLISDKYELKWTIVEQRHFIDFGKDKLQDAILKFQYIDEVQINKNDCILFSSVLQYIENYEEILCSVLKNKPQYVILERTPVGNSERIVVETVKEPIYNATYTCRMLSEKKIIQILDEQGYKLIDTWLSLVDRDIFFLEGKYSFKSFVFKIGDKC